MTIVSPMGQLRPVFADKNGKRLSGGKVFTYEPGTLTPKATYSDALNLIPNTNPINLDESGEADIYLDGGYRMQVYDRYGTLIQDVDNFRTWASGIPAESIFYGSQDLKQFNADVESSLNNRYTKEETYSKSEVDSSITAVSGGHKAYQTLALAQADQGTLPVNTIVEVTNDGANNGTYQWNGTTLTKSDYDPLTQAKEGAAIKANAARKETLATLATASSNLFNDATSIKENKTISVTGEIITPSSADDWAYSDFITIEPNQNYFYDGFRYIAYYDVNKNFIGRVDSVRTGSGTFPDPYKFTGALLSPSNAYFIRVIYRAQLTTEYTDINRKINLGSSPTPYEPFYLKLREEIDIQMEIEDNSISKEKLDFIKYSTNLFNHNAVTFGKTVLGDGVISDNAGYAISDFIAVDKNKSYMISSETGYSAFPNTAFYDANENFIRRENTPSSTEPYAITSAFLKLYNVAFVRFNINVAGTGQPNQRNRMFNEGATALPYEPYYEPRLEGVSVENADGYLLPKASPATLGGVKIGSGINIDEDGVISVGGGGSASFDQSTNLFNAFTATTGVAIASDGTISTNADYSISDFIPVIAGQKYTISGEKWRPAFIYTAYYDEDKNFISRASTSNNTSNTGSLTITIPANVAFVRFSMNQGLPTERNRMFNVGDTALPFEWGGDKADITLSQNSIKKLETNFVSKTVVDKLMLDMPVDGVFTTDVTWQEDYTDFASAVYADVYAKYDALVAAYPDYVAKQVLGNDDQGNPVNLYRFTPKRPSSSSYPYRNPKVFLTTGTHGMEHSAVLTGYLMFEQLCKNWKSDPLLEALRFNVNFLIIPVVNPSGFNAYTRKNANGIDLNRNFPEGWGWQSNEPSSEYYGGAAPLDQKEAQYIFNVFNSNRDIDIMYDFHNFNGSAQTSPSHLIWIPAPDQYVQHMCQMLVQRMTRHWQKKFPWIPQTDTYFAGFSDNTHGAMVQDHARARGIKFTATFECGGQWWIDPDGLPNDTSHQQSCVEALVNWLLINLNELKRI